MKSKKRFFTLEENHEIMRALDRGEEVGEFQCFYCRRYLNPSKADIHFMSRPIAFLQLRHPVLEKAPHKFIFACKQCHDSFFGSDED